MAESLLYVANNRLPTEKAHGLQIVQMCEALADAGYSVTLAAPGRINTPEMRQIGSLWEHYGVRQNFVFRRVPCLDLIRLFPRHSIGLLVQTVSYLLVLLAGRLVRRAHIIYTRDMFLGAGLRLARPRARLVYEVHQMHHSRVGRWLQGWLARRSCVVALTGPMAARLTALGASRVMVAHDGFRAGRFADLPARADARAALGLAPGLFLVGYIGRLHTLNMPKGLDTLVEALSRAAQVGVSADLLLVGGPDEGIAAVRAQWSALGLDLARLHAVGQVPPDDVPSHLAALDVGVLPLPWTEHFAYFASALKLFEYMAAGCTVIASDLPGTAEVVRDGESALLVPPGDAGALAGAIRRLHADPALRERLAGRARAAASQYTWDARAARIRSFVEG